MPDTTADALKQWISNQIEQYKTTGSMTDILSGIVNQKIAQQIALQLPFTNQSFAKLSKKQLSMLVEKATYGLKQTVVTITETKSFVQAQVTAGGISTEEIDAGTMESKLVSGLYFAGEIMDVDGMCGGYNLQWAWASGYIAGQNAGKKIVRIL